jgi:LuxR family maltose regulon positive regulatory protein
LPASRRARCGIRLTAEARTIADSCRDLGVIEGRLAALEGSPRTRPPASGRESNLSARELVVLRLLRGSLSERDIGRELYLSHNTIHSHTKSIYRKLGAASRQQAVEKARELGLI